MRYFNMIITLKPLVPKSEMREIDRPLLHYTEFHLRVLAEDENDAEERALDVFSETVPIKVLEHFDISVEKKETH